MVSSCGHVKHTCLLSNTADPSVCFVRFGCVNDDILMMMMLCCLLRLIRAKASGIFRRIVL